MTSATAHGKEKKYSCALPACPLVVAVRTGSVEMIKVLLDLDARSDGQGAIGVSANGYNLDTALQEAMRLSVDVRRDIVQVLIESGAKPHAGSGFEASPLFSAACSGDVECLRIMIDGYTGARKLSRAARQKACNLRGHSTAYFNEIDSREVRIGKKCLFGILLSRIFHQVIVVITIE